MQAVILAAGEGKRMRPLTLEKPKPLIEVAGKPLIVHVLDALPEEIDEVIVVLGYKGDMIRAYLGDSHNGRALHYVHQWMPAGTAHALSIARPFITGKFMFLNADDILGAEALQEALKHPLAILVSTHDKPETMGVVTKRADGTLERIDEKPEKPASNLVNTGTMVLDERLFAFEAPRHASGEYYMTDPVSLLAKEHPITVIEQPVWIPVGYPDDITKAESQLKSLGR
jgi:UDP-N-acetylglucosamine diphosphorylase / glucose-1-phosphate thymidylyltransferase / UDP-N-acetylgalactosamine diphosphorylase / glucosamine-1-phosphate N-acetyltransferase / galactosamine-1-phosphate N-acetyltransferase